MSLKDLETLQGEGLSRAHIEAGTRITEGLWRAAHSEHDRRAELHSAACHGAGVVWGMQVTSTDPPSPYVTIHPGLAVDPLGRPIAVTTAEPDRALRVFNAGAAPGWIHILLQHSELKPAAVDAVSGNHQRIDERPTCIASPRPPEPHQIELARVLVKAANSAIKEPTDPWDPKEGELDYRFRTQLGSGLRGYVSVGQIGPGVAENIKKWEGFDGGRTAISLLLRHARLGGPFQTTYSPFVRLAGDEKDCSLLIATGKDSLVLTQEQVDQLRVFVAAGGTLFAEGALPGFEVAARALAERISIKLAPVAAGHPVLCSHQVFASPPAGGPTDLGGFYAGQATGGLGGMLLSTRDYFSAWAGKGTLERGRIRDASDFGVNILAHALTVRTQAGLVRQSRPKQSAVS